MSKPLTRTQMEDVIASGGSVIFDGKLISHKEHLPSKADLAKGDPEKEAAAESELRAQIAKMQAQLDKLTPPATENDETPGFQSVADDAADLYQRTGGDLDIAADILTTAKGK